MNIFTLITLAFGMSMDSCAAAIAKGADKSTPHLLTALKSGLFFGVIEAIAPMIGFFIGQVANEWVANIDHWLAFGLLGFLGCRFLYEAFSTDEDNDDQAQRTKSDGLMLLILTACATSIDSVVVGISLAFMGVNIYLASMLIGVATTIMATLGLYLGSRLGAKFGNVAMGVGGVVLIIIGTFILYSHLTA